MITPNRMEFGGELNEIMHETKPSPYKHSKMFIINIIIIGEG